ncbi:HAUS augmin-like complex subunit 5, partial [Ophiophagus hannah]
MASGENVAGGKARGKGASLAQELRRWAAEEMKLPPGKVPSERDARRYQQMEKSEGKPSASESNKERRKHLIQAISRLKEEDQQLDLQIGLVQREFRYDSTHLQDVSDSADKLPSVRVLIQEGWTKCEVLCVQQVPLHAEEKGLLACLEALLRAVRLRGYRDGLLQGCQGLEEAVKVRYAELQNLQAKRQRILDFRHLNEKQQHIRALIKGTSFLKSQLRKNQVEIQDFIQKKLLPQAQQVQLEAQKLHNRVGREVQHFKTVSLPYRVTRQIAGSQHIPAHKLSIHRLSWTASSENQAFLNVCSAINFPLYKAPEQLLLHLVELKKKLAYLRAQLSSKQRALGSLQHQLEATSEPDVPSLVKEVQSHDQKQAFLLLPCIQRMMDQCQCLIKRRPELQAIIDN